MVEVRGETGNTIAHVVTVCGIDGYFQPWERGIETLMVAKAFAEAAGISGSILSGPRDDPDAMSDTHSVYRPGEDSPAMVLRRIGIERKSGGLNPSDNFRVTLGKDLESNWEVLEMRALGRLREDYPEQFHMSFRSAFQLFWQAFSQSSSGGRGLW